MVDIFWCVYILIFVTYKNNIHYFIFFIVFGMSLFLSIYDVSDKDKDDKAFPIIVLIINVIVGGMMLLNYKR